MGRKNCSLQARPSSTLNIFDGAPPDGRFGREERIDRQYEEDDSETRDAVEEGCYERDDVKHWSENELTRGRSDLRVANTAGQHPGMSDCILPEEIPGQSYEEECSGVDFGGCARVRRSDVVRD